MEIKVGTVALAGGVVLAIVGLVSLAKTGRIPFIGKQAQQIAGKFPYA